MDLREYVDDLRDEFLTATEAGGIEDRALAERVFTQLASAIRLTLLAALSDAADEITREIAPASVHVRLRGREPAFVVTSAGQPADEAVDASSPAPVPPPVEGDEGGTSRINLRLPDHLKAGVEEAAGRAGLSVNAWLVRAAAGALEPGRTPGRRNTPQSSQSFTGWAR